MASSDSHKNFMGAECYELFNPIQALRLPLCSQFLGEPSYYMPAKDEVHDGARVQAQILDRLGDHVMFPKYVTDICLVSQGSF